jgi:hypothetical protein
MGGHNSKGHHNSGHMANPRLTPCHTTIPNYHKQICSCVDQNASSQSKIYIKPWHVSMGSTWRSNKFSRSSINWNILFAKSFTGLQNFMNFQRVCAKNKYRDCKMNSMWDTNGSLDNTTIIRLVNL